VPLLELLLGRARPADEDTLEPLEEVLLGKEDGTRTLADLGIELVDGDLAQPPEPGCRLAAFPHLTRHRRVRPPHRFDPVAAQEPPVRLALVEDEQAVDVLLLEHLPEGFELEIGAAAVHVEVEGLRRLYDGALEVGAVAVEFYRAAEDCYPFLGRPLVVLEPGEDGGDGALDIGPRLLGLDVRALPELVLELVGHVIDLLIRRDVEGYQFRPV